MPRPRLYDVDDRPDNPWIEELTHAINYDDYFDEERRRAAIAAYHGMVSYLDHNVGLLLDALDRLDLAHSTRVIYTSDHGEMLGNHGIWGKCCMYQEAVGIPLIMAGAEIPAGLAAGSEASLIDCYPTILEAVGAPLDAAEAKALPGRSLSELARRPDPSRVGFSEYHGIGSKGGAFMVRRGRWKYVHYVGLAPQLFDLEADPYEAVDLAHSTSYGGIRAEMEAVLRRIVDPDRASLQAMEDQEAKIGLHGGAEAIMAKGEFGHTPTPGERADYAPPIQG
jgi:choline-sulfatase